MQLIALLVFLRLFWHLFDGKNERKKVNQKHKSFFIYLICSEIFHAKKHILINIHIFQFTLFIVSSNS